MSNKNFNKIKKQNGEEFAKILRNYHNGIFEIPDVVSIVKHAGRGKDAERILSYLVNLLSAEADKEEKPGDPFELLSQAGYDAYYADTLEKQNAISKHFEKDEELCTFRDSSRFQNYYIINAVKKNVSEIRRKDFIGKEKREDEYGTSVISIQVAKRGGFISIKNRYNHKVENCDNTFKSNPDNIIQGLSQAIQAHFDVKFSSVNNHLPDDYVLAGKQLVKVNQEIEGVYFGDHAFVKNGALVEMKEHEYLFDYFIFNAQTKTFTNVLDIQDSFPEVFNGAYGGSPTVYVKDHCIYDGDIMLVGV